jgi:hypothetical protein
MLARSLGIHTRPMGQEVHAGGDGGKSPAWQSAGSIRPIVCVGTAVESGKREPEAELRRAGGYSRFTPAARFAGSSWREKIG